MQVRAAELSDLEAVLALARVFYQQEGFTTPEGELRRHLGVLVQSPAARVAVIDVTGQPAAFAITTASYGLEDGYSAELEDLYVCPAARRHGLATQLINDSAAWARMRGCQVLDVVVAPHGTEVDHLIGYYRDRGFVDEGRRLLSRRL